MHVNQESDPPRLLVVDDDSVASHLVTHQLAAAGFQPQSAGSAAEARRRLTAESFDLLLLDAGLKDADAFALCRDLKSDPRLHDLPVLLMATRDALSDIWRGFDAGAADYVVKPVDPRVMIARVRAHVSLRRLSGTREADTVLALAGERERRRLADQLHDSTIQQLALARVLLDRPEDSAPLGRVKALLDLSLSQLRSLVFELGPPALAADGLYPALEWLATQMAERWSVRVRCRLDGTVAQVAQELQTVLFQAARELINNVGKHARARECRVTLRYRADRVGLEVSDDGVGLGHGVAAAGQGGFGLVSLSSRIALLGGNLTLQNGSNGGSVASLWIPVAPIRSGSCDAGSGWTEK